MFNPLRKFSLRSFSFLALVFIVFMACLFTSFSVDAKNQDIYVLRFAPPGGNIAVWTDAIIDTLKDNGYNPILVPFKNCKEGFKWFQNHKTYPSVFWGQSDAAVLNDIAPNNPAVCGFPVNQDTLVTIISKWWSFICGHKGINDSFKAMHRGTPKIAIYNHPVKIGVLKAQMKAMGVKADVITFAHPKDQLQAFVSGDVDYIVLNNENLAKSMPNTDCFGTTASVTDAKRYQPGQISFATQGDVPFIGYGNWALIQAENVDMKRMRDIFAHHQSPMMKKLVSAMRPVSEPITQQLADIKAISTKLKALSQK